MKKFIHIYILLFSAAVFSQIDANSLIGLPTATTTEMNAVISPKLGSILYNTTDDKIYKYTSTGWQSNETQSYVGSFIISGNGDITVPTPNFTPTSVTFSAHANVEAFNINEDNGVGNNNTSINNSFGSMNGFARIEPDGTTVEQNFIYVGGSGNSINDISRFSSDNDAIGIRYGNQNGDDLGRITAKVNFTLPANGFTVTATYTPAGTNTDVNNEDLVVLYTAYK